MDQKFFLELKKKEVLWFDFSLEKGKKTLKPLYARHLSSQDAKLVLLY
jgi:hypothetical protein